MELKTIVDCRHTRWFQCYTKPCDGPTVIQWEGMAWLESPTSARGYSMVLCSHTRRKVTVSLAAVGLGRNIQVEFVTTWVPPFPSGARCFPSREHRRQASSSSTYKMPGPTNPSDGSQAAATGRPVYQTQQLERRLLQTATQS